MINIIDAYIEGEPSLSTNDVFEILQIDAKLTLLTANNFKAIMLKFKALNHR